MAWSAGVLKKSMALLAVNRMEAGARSSPNARRRPSSDNDMIVLLLLGYVSAGIGLGDWALRRFRAGQAERTAWRAGTAALAILVIALLARIPWLGGLVALLVLLTGLGALVLQAWRVVGPGAADHQLRYK